jgi:SAM-dependent methyltransferase
VTRRSDNRWLARGGARPADYDARFAALASAGVDVHGEATLVASLGVRSVLDAGCGTGRVAIELARRGLEAVGVDADTEMLDRAQEQAPTLRWVHADLVVMAGNVLLFLAPGDEPEVIANLARHLVPSGLLLAGFSLNPGGLTPAAYDRMASQAGLDLVDRWATWDRRPFHPGGADYAVSLHRAPAPGGADPQVP